MKKHLLTLNLLGTAILTLSACSPNSTPQSTEQTSQTTKVSDSTDSKNNTADISDSTDSKNNTGTIRQIAEKTQKSMDKLYEENPMLNETYKDITVSFEGQDTLVITYVYRDILTKESIPQQKENLEKTRDTLINATKMDADNVKKMIPDYKVKYIYVTSDGTPVYETLITKSDYNK